MLGNILEIAVLVIMLGGAILLAYMAITEMINFMQTRVPFVPTSKEDIADLVEHLGITETDFVFDIGSGNGKVLFIIEQLTKAQTRGLQRAGWTQTYAKIRKCLTGSKIELLSGNFFDFPWSEATVVYAYLYPFLMRQVGEKALHECKPGTKIVARDFPIPNLRLLDYWETPSHHNMFIYIIS